MSAHGDHADEHLEDEHANGHDDHHAPPPLEEPATPLWLTLLGIGLFLTAGILFVATRDDGKTTAELTAELASDAPAPSAAPAPAAPPQPGAANPAAMRPGGAPPGGAPPGGAPPGGARFNAPPNPPGGPAGAAAPTPRPGSTRPGHEGHDHE